MAAYVRFRRQLLLQSMLAATEVQGRLTLAEHYRWAASILATSLTATKRNLCEEQLCIFKRENGNFDEIFCVFF